MGWKSTLTLTRGEAISAILEELAKIHPINNQQVSNAYLENMMDAMFGDDAERPYYGHNFLVVDSKESD